MSELLIFQMALRFDFSRALFLMSLISFPACEYNVHKGSCAESIEEQCSGMKRKLKVMSFLKMFVFSLKLPFENV